jgi:hypothetical protein
LWPLVLAIAQAGPGALDVESKSIAWLWWHCYRRSCQIFRFRAVCLISLKSLEYCSLWHNQLSWVVLVLIWSIYCCLQAYYKLAEIHGSGRAVSLAAIKCAPGLCKYLGCWPCMSDIWSCQLHFWTNTWHPFHQCPPWCFLGRLKRWAHCQNIVGLHNALLLYQIRLSWRTCRLSRDHANKHILWGLFVTDCWSNEIVQVYEGVGIETWSSDASFAY